MKILKKTFFVWAMILACAFTVKAQTKADKRTAQEASFKKTIDSRNYTFTAQSANPLRGMTRQLTSEYDVRITKDTVTAYLPYFGRAYVAPMNPSEGGIHFTSTKFSYDARSVKKGFEITIVPADAGSVRKLFFSVSVNGYATLTVTDLNRDPISFYGHIDANKQAKK